jgi:hypothetical protein
LLLAKRHGCLWGLQPWSEFRVRVVRLRRHLGFELGKLRRLRRHWKLRRLRELDRSGVDLR